MSWTDAARAASLAARRAHMRGKVVAGKRVHPRILYHGGPKAWRGAVINGAQVYATYNREVAQSYARRSDYVGGAVYRVKPPHIPKDVTWYRKVIQFGKLQIARRRYSDAARSRAWIMPSAQKLFNDPGYSSRKVPLRILGRSIRARGRASRGKY